jgi:hypothetical protein
MKKDIKKTLLIVVTLFLCSCHKIYFEDGRHQYFIFDNKSNLDIVVDRYHGNHSGRDHSTNIISVDRGRIEANNFDIIVYANSRKDRLLTLLYESYEHLFREIKYDTIKLFIFDYAKIVSMDDDEKSRKSLPFDSVFLQRYDLTVKDLDAINWTLSFPPDDRMKDMKMYPPYNSEK